MSNRMRNIHKQLYLEYGKENVRIFRQWEKYERKMADFSNHRRFTLRCLSEGLVPVSLRLSRHIKTPKGTQIIKRAERALLNERVRSINNTLIMLKSQIDTCMDRLERAFNTKEDGVWLERCREFIRIGREQQHQKTLKRQSDKFN